MQPLAYRVPFIVDRSRAPVRYYLVNRSAETLDGMRLAVLGSGLLLPLSQSRLLPGAVLGFAVRGHDLARNSVVIVRWFRPNGDEYLWRVSF
ncbi:hypothetical protein GCM10027413_25300 [Conyzicola nivalis]|uniref:Uncharacterized protein n=1 Tax=Conyzicola nivalis TaxID=1477021 RepID=A0A916S9G4_9MICO|nr:hypothetical protein [Conyzicola nivalis]GGA90358.1 hypothetical protein GCM10010979_01310 [Conyzicola nivalis]